MMTEIRLFQLACKGDRLDAINAEEVFNQQAKAVERQRALLRLVKRVVASLGRKGMSAIKDGPEILLSPQR